jgi:hypothetical protein
LILHAEGTAIQDRFNITIEIPESGNGSGDDVGRLSFTVDPYTCNRVITRTVSTRCNRKIDVTFVAMHTAIQANVEVTLDLISGSAFYVYGEISARHQLYGDERVMLFSREPWDKVEVVNGILPMSRKWAAVPIYMEPLLTIKLNLRVATDHDGEGPIISFRGDITFYREEYEKILRSADHGDVKVRLSYW